MGLFDSFFTGDQEWFEVTFLWTHEDDGRPYSLTELFEPFKPTRKALSDLIDWFILEHPVKDESTVKIQLEKITWTWRNAPND